MAFILRWVQESADTYDLLKTRAQRSLQSRQENKRGKPGRDEGLFKQVHKCLTLLADNPRHPGLQTHEFHSIENPVRPGEKVFEAYVQNRTPGAYRVFWCYGPRAGEITILAIVPHP